MICSSQITNRLIALFYVVFFFTVVDVAFRAAAESPNRDDPELARKEVATCLAKMRIPPLKEAPFVECVYKSPMIAGFEPVKCLGFVLSETPEEASIFTLDFDTIKFDLKHPDHGEIQGHYKREDFHEFIVRLLDELDATRADDYHPNGNNKGELIEPLVEIERGICFPWGGVRLFLMAQVASDRGEPGASKLFDHAINLIRILSITKEFKSLPLTDQVELELALVCDRQWLIQLHRPESSWQELEARANWIATNLPDPPAEFRDGPPVAAAFKKRAEIIAKMRKQPLLQALPLPPGADPNVAKEVQRLIRGLSEQSAPFLVSGGGYYYDPESKDSPVVKLLAIGKKAVPFLIEALDDERLTRTVGEGMRKISEFEFQVGDLAEYLINDIAGPDFDMGERTPDRDSGGFLASATAEENRAFRERARKKWQEFAK